MRDWTIVPIGFATGRTHLLAVVAVVSIRVATQNSHGTPVTVNNGKFDTWGSLTGIVREIWLNEKVYID